MMRRDITQKVGKRSNTQGVVIWYCDVMFPVLLRRQANVTARLTNNPIAEAVHRFREFCAGKITRNSHAANTSSRTI